MNQGWTRRLGVLGLSACALCGCLRLKHAALDRMPAGGDHYRVAARSIRFVDATTPLGDGLAAHPEPRRIRSPDESDLWNVSLAEALRIALENNAILRDRQFLSPANPLLANPDQTPSVFDPAIQESGGVFGGRGLDAALADFDPWFRTSMLWGRDEQVQNNRFLSGGLRPGETLTDEIGLFAARLEQPLANGGLVALSHEWDYSLNNIPNRLFGSSYVGLLRAEYRQPLWAGAGQEFTSIAGPHARHPGAPAQGVVIARLNNEISVADFEARTQLLLKNVEDLYWELSLAYRVYESQRVARDNAFEVWKKVKGRADAGLGGVGVADEAQALENYHERKTAASDALADLYEAEGRLRRLIGLPVNDGRLMTPADQPLEIEFAADWYAALHEALARRIELRRQQANVRSLSLQLQAARSLSAPNLDFVSGYHVNAFGDTLIGGDERPEAYGFHSAYNTLLNNNQTGWNLGLEFSMPLGFRAADAQVRNLELRLAKATTALSAQELEISHELSHALRELDRWYETAQSNHDRWLAARRRVQAVEANFSAGFTSLDLLLRSQVSLAEAEVAWYRSLAEYNKALAEFHYRKGSLLERHNVHLAEGVNEPLLPAERHKTGETGGRG
ncbi:MAG TPA: TolC family protein [Planctomycetaceae bacterium]|nr:TolC family protein [Planctomycetaceae bacterium]